MLNRFVVNLIISFILKQISKVHDKIDWVALKAEVDAKVRDLVPGTWFDDEAVRLIDTILAACEQVLTSHDELKAILQLLAAEKYDDAGEKLKLLVLGSLHVDVPMEIMRALA